MVYTALSEFIDNGIIKRIHPEIPALLKTSKGPMWTGKQVISTLLKNLSFHEQDYTDQYNNKKLKIGLNLISRSRLDDINWGFLGKDENQVHIRNNELLQGILDKNQIGDSKFGMIHSFYEIYGSKRAGQLLTALGRLLTSFLQYHGFTCGVDDALLDKKTNIQREKILKNAFRKGIQAGAQFCGIESPLFEEDSGNKPKQTKKIEETKGAKDSVEDEQSADKIDEREEKRIIQEIKLSIQRRFINEGLHIENEFDRVVQSEMDEATTKVIDDCIPSGLIKDFPHNNISSMVLTGAKGGKVNRSQIVCLLGQQALEGKRVPRMPNGKTLPCFAAFDPNPRSSGFISDRFISGLRPQDFFFHCMAGREGLVDTAVKTARSGYLQRCLIKQLESLVVSYDSTVRNNDGSILQFLYGEDGIDTTKMLYLNKFDFTEQNYAAMLTNYYSDNIMSSIDTESVPKLKKEQKINKKKDIKSIDNCDPILSKFNPSRYLGAISEKMNDDLRKFNKNHKKSKEQDDILNIRPKKIKSSTLEKLCYFKYLFSLAHPGENVGTLAGQSIGEPSTQMTLNTFHLAGHGGTNVTLGIPRLREILMTCSENLKTPLMILPLRKDIEFTESEISAFANKFQKLKLSEVTNNVKIDRDFILKGKSAVFSIYNLTFEFEDMKRINETFSITDADLKKVFTVQFIPLLMKNITKQTKRGFEDTSIVNKGAKSKHMQTKETQEDEEFLKTYQQDLKMEKRRSVDISEIDDPVNVEDGISTNKIRDQIETYGNDVEEDKVSETQNKSSHAYDDDNMTIEEFEDIDSISNKTGIKIDMSKSLSSFKPFLQNILYFDQQNSPFTRAQIKITLHLPLEINKNGLNKILMLSLVEAIMQKVLIRSVRGIERSVVIERKHNGKKEKVVQTEGINFQE